MLYYIHQSVSILTAIVKGDPVMKSIQSKFLTIVISGMLVLAIAITALTVVYISAILENDANNITESVSTAETVEINELLNDK